MAPGVLARDGFLGSDPRPLEEIIETDRSTLVGLGTTREEVAGRLQGMFDTARAALGTPVRINDRLTAVHRDAMGRIPCPFGGVYPERSRRAQGRPWGGCGTFPKGEVELTDAAAGQTILLTALGIHMLAHHGFCQGRGSRYRLEPATIVQLV
jgi:hypothetical protein